MDLVFSHLIHIWIDMSSSYYWDIQDEYKVHPQLWRNWEIKRIEMVSVWLAGGWVEYHFSRQLVPDFPNEQNKFTLNVVISNA